LHESPIFFFVCRHRLDTADAQPVLLFLSAATGLTWQTHSLFWHFCLPLTIRALQLMLKYVLQYHAKMLM
jgi:hypothetical protein